jgi:hypothetical protein
MAMKTTVYAFVLEAKKSLFGKETTDQDLDKIRQEVRAPGADVQVIPPGEWKAPKVRSTSEQDLGGKMLEILSRVQDWFFIHAYHDGIDKTLTKGVIIRPKDGKKAYFAFKVEKEA